MANTSGLMNATTVTLIAAAGMVLSGCATGKSGLVLDTVGPVPAQATLRYSTPGTLVVYSDYDANADFNRRDPYRPEYSDYTIYTADGRLSQRVHNDSGTIRQNPVSVKLAAGKYRVVARANGYGSVTVPVIIAAQQTTILHLEGGAAWPDKSVFNQTNAVRLPDGRIVGWRAAPDA